MRIDGPHGPLGVNPVFEPRRAGTADAVRPTGLEMPRDEIQISPEARMLEEISRTGDIRQDRIDEIRRMIASGVYETPEKLALALDRLLDELKTTGQAPDRPAGQ